MKDNNRIAHHGDVDECSKPERLVLLQEELRRLTDLGFGVVTVAATYPCDNHGCHCAFATGMHESATDDDLQAIIDGLRANLRGLEAKIKGTVNPSRTPGTPPA